MLACSRDTLYCALLSFLVVDLFDILFMGFVGTVLMMLLR